GALLREGVVDLALTIDDVPEPSRLATRAEAVHRVDVAEVEVGVDQGPGPHDAQRATAVLPLVKGVESEAVGGELAGGIPAGRDVRQGGGIVESNQAARGGDAGIGETEAGEEDGGSDGELDL